MIVSVYSNVRINTGTVTIYKNNVATAFKVDIPPLATGVIRGLTELTFEAGDIIHGVIDFPQQDIEDPLYTGTVCRIIGIWCEMDTGEAEHWGVYAKGPNYTQSESYGYFLQGEFRNSRFATTDPNMIQPNTDKVYLSLGAELGYETSLRPNGNIIYSSYPEDIDTTYIASKTNAELLVAAQTKVYVPGVFSNFRNRMFIDGAFEGGGDLISSGTHYLDVNGSPTSLAVGFDQEYGDSFWVSVQDEANTAAVVAADLVCIGGDLFPNVNDGDLYIPGCSPQGFYSFKKASFDFQATSGEQLDVFLTCSTEDGQTNGTLGSGEYTLYDLTGVHLQPPFGRFEKDGDIEATDVWRVVSLQPPHAWKLSNLRVNCIEYEGDPVTISFAIDGVDTGYSITVNGLGWFENTTDTITVRTDEAVCLRTEVASGQTFNGIMVGLAYTQEPGDQTNGNGCLKVCDTALTLAELRQRTLRMLGEDPDAPVYWSNDEIDRYINDAYIMAARDTKAIEFTEAILLTADSQAGTLSDSVGRILRVTWDDTKIHNQTKWEMDRAIADWENQSGDITNYITTLQDQRTIKTYKAWDGTTTYAYDVFMDGTHTYTAWEDIEYDAGARVTHVAADGTKRAYYTEYGTEGSSGYPEYYEPGVGSDWTDIWQPLGLMVWAVKIPNVLTECDEPEFPTWSHLGLAYAAAAMALGKHGEQGDSALGAVYEAVANEYAALLKAYINNRTPERAIGMGRSIPMYRPRPWDTVIVP